MKVIAALAGFVLVLMGCQLDPTDDIVGHISERDLKDQIVVLSHDTLLGRGPGTEGDRRATAYLAGEMKKYGLEPAGENGSYVQDVPLVGYQVSPSTSLLFKKGSRSVSFKFRDDFVVRTDVFDPTVTLRNADVVFVGYGIVAPEQDWDDYKGVDVSGKILLMLNNDPATDDPNFFAGNGRTYYGRWTYKYEIAAKKGAAGAIVIHTEESAGYPYQVIQGWAAENFDLAGSGSQQRLKLKAWTTEQATRSYLSLAGFDLDKLTASAQEKSFRPVPLGVSLSTTIRLHVRRINTHNILGIVRGSDPDLNKEMIVITSHYDHFGVGEPVDGDSIYNGALDNASGVSMTLNLARAFAAQRESIKRSLLIAAVGAEEHGLLGSQYLSENPPVPVSQLAANINIDGINVWGRTEDITFLGEERSTLGADIAAVAGTMGMVVRPDPHPEQGYFYRSDHFNFAKAGVPCLSMESGTAYIGKPESFAEDVIKEYNEKHYHQPSDEIQDDWVYDGAIQQAEFVVRLILRIANASAMPSWKAGDEFEAARLEALSKR